MEGSFLNVMSVERFSTERRAGREGEAGGTGEREDISLMEQVSREAKGNWFQSTGRRDWTRGGRIPLPPRQEGWGRRRHLERSVQRQEEVGASILSASGGKVHCWEGAVGEDLRRKTENGIAEKELGTGAR